MNSNTVIRMRSGQIHHTSMFAEEVVSLCVCVEGQYPDRRLVTLPRAEFPPGTFAVNPEEIESVEPDPFR